MAHRLFLVSILTDVENGELHWICNRIHNNENKKLLFQEICGEIWERKSFFIYSDIEISQVCNNYVPFKLEPIF